MRECKMTFEDALCFPVKMGFVLFTDAATANGLVPVLTYDDKDRVAEMKRTGKTWFIR